VIPRLQILEAFHGWRYKFHFIELHLRLIEFVWEFKRGVEDLKTK
jgi:hypothetical protein